MGQLRDGADVGDLQHRVRRRFDQHRLGVGAHRRFPGLGIGRVDKGGLNAEARQPLADDPAAGAPPPACTAGPGRPGSARRSPRRAACTWGTGSSPSGAARRPTGAAPPAPSAASRGSAGRRSPPGRRARSGTSRGAGWSWPAGRSAPGRR